MSKPTEIEIRALRLGGQKLFINGQSIIGVTGYQVESSGPKQITVTLTIKTEVGAVSITKESASDV